MLDATRESALTWVVCEEPAGVGGAFAVTGTAKRSVSRVQCRANSDRPGGHVVMRERCVIHSGHSAKLDRVGEEDTLLHSPNRHETG